jgi:hypothetical protein
MHVRIRQLLFVRIGCIVSRAELFDSDFGISSRILWWQNWLSRQPPATKQSSRQPPERSARNNTGKQAAFGMQDAQNRTEARQRVNAPLAQLALVLTVDKM